jgi:5-deoxy-glucuronate isomerase
MTDARSFVVRQHPDRDVFLRVSGEQHGLEKLNMVAMSLATGKKFALATNQYSYGAVILGGVCDIRTSQGTFADVGRRTDVFTGMPYAIYLPPNTDFEIESLSDDFQFASCWATTSSAAPLRLIRPHEVPVRLSAVGRVSVQTNTILEGELSMWEMYVPAANWAHFPPQAAAASDALLLCKQDRLTGFAMHRLYDDRTDTALVSSHNDLVIVPRGVHHTMVSSPLGATYVLGMSAGSAAYTQDGRYAWYSRVHGNAAPDPRLPIVDIGMEPNEDEA